MKKRGTEKDGTISAESRRIFPPSLSDLSSARRGISRQLRWRGSDEIFRYRRASRRAVSHEKRPRVIAIRRERRMIDGGIELPAVCFEKIESAYSRCSPTPFRFLMA